MTVLSLCDGMSCGQIALKKLGINVDKYFASEIKDIAIKVTKHNFPNTIFLGDLNKIFYKNGVLYTENGNFEVKIDLVIFGSPCQSFSIIMPKHLRVGLENLEKSGLFYQCNRILKEVNPKYWFMENVASMKDEDRDLISNFLETQPYKINSSQHGPCLRNRYYWTNLKYDSTVFSNLKLNDILTTGFSDRDKARCLLAAECRPLKTPIKMYFRYKKFTNLIFKDKEHYNRCKEEYNRLVDSVEPKKINAKFFDNYTGKIFDGVRYLNRDERELCHGIPKGYTNCLTEKEAADVIGDGWHIDTICCFFKNLK